MAVTGGFCPLPLRLGGDAETGWTATQHARFCADLVAAKRTAKLCTLSWDAVSIASTPATITSYRGMNGAGLGFAPTSSVATADAITFLFTSGRFTDDYQVSAPILVRHARVTAAGSTYRKPVVTLHPNGVTIRFFDAAGAIVNPQPGGTCSLW